MAVQALPRRLIRVETHAGEPIAAKDKTIIPFAQALIVQIPGRPVGLVWNRPSAVVVRSASGEEEVLPVKDVTRQVQLALLGASAGVLLLSLTWDLITSLMRR